MMNEGGADRWGVGKRLAFCFAFVYLLLYLLPAPLEYLPYIGAIFEPYYNGWSAVVKWVGSTLLAVTVSVEPNGSGDTTFSYIQTAVIFAASVVIGLLWAVLDRRRPNYIRLHQWLRIYVRFALATTMFSYGFSKVIPVQFPPPSLGRLMQPFGEASPMGLLWAFMGASASYTIFAGAAEVLAGLLLTTRRTTLAGALVCAGVMTNVVIMNFSYDVPVKLYSTHLLLMAVFLMLPDLGRLWRFFVTNRAVEPAELARAFPSPAMHYFSVTLRTVFFIYVGYNMVRGSLARQQRFEKVTSPLQGIWSADQFSVNGKEVAPLLTEGQRWRRVAIDRTAFDVLLVNDSRTRYQAKLEPKNHTLELQPRYDAGKKYTLTYAQPSPTELVVSGSLEGQTVRAVLHRMDSKEFLLIGRGFHWINEVPFNR